MAGWFPLWSWLSAARDREAAYRFQREFDLRERRIVGVNATSTSARTRRSRSSRSRRARSRTTWPGWSEPGGSARRERGGGGAARPARGGRSPRVVGFEPDASLHPLRRRIRDAREMCGVLRWRFRRVPRAGRGLGGAALYLNALEFLAGGAGAVVAAFEPARQAHRRAARPPDRPRLTTGRAATHRPPRRLAGRTPCRLEGARGRRDVGDEDPIRQGMG